MPNPCTSCGACCLNVNLLPLTEGIAPAIPAHLRAELEAIAAGPLKGRGAEPCVWLNRATCRCEHYEHRPPVCREFALGRTTCNALRKLVGLKPLFQSIILDKPANAAGLLTTNGGEVEILK